MPYPQKLQLTYQCVVQGPKVMTGFAIGLLQLMFLRYLHKHLEITDALCNVSLTENKKHVITSYFFCEVKGTKQI